MKPSIAIVAFWGCTTLGGMAHAEVVKMQPGLWEHGFTMKTESGQAERALSMVQQQMANLPPEQRKMVEQMMASRGVSMSPKGSSIKACLSKEDAERGDLPKIDGNCQQQVVRSSSNTLKVTFTCKGNPPSSGEGEVTFQSPTAYTGRSVVNTMVAGKPERVSMEQTGRWLSADCGSLKPMSR